MVLEVSAGIEERNIEKIRSVADKVTHLSDRYCDNGCPIKENCSSFSCSIKALLNKIEGRES